ncbi:MAG: aldo/keto reductase [Myxococcales bacterium]|nr:aldo/keto reductase [Myxococcales bacterium]MCB9733655.1 aldo/keto reductase [Deltaproteobacteria bacterium]
MTTMRTVRFGRTGLQVPIVSLGTWSYGGESQTGGGAPVGWSGHDDATARSAMLAAYRAGITHWDTADVYGDGRSERLIGTMWEEVPRDAIVLASKVGWDRGSHSRWYHPEMIREHLDASLKNLRTDHLDILYFHHADFGPGDDWLDDALAVFHEAKKAGKIRFIGLSDWDSERIMRVVARVDPDVVQPYRNVTHDDYVLTGLAGWVAEHDLGVAFFSPIRHGLLLGKYSTSTIFPAGDFRATDPSFSDPRTLERLAHNAAVLRRRYADRAEPVLSALTGAILDDAPTATVLLGQRSPAQVRAAALAGCGSPLGEVETRWVRGLYYGIT